MGGVLLASASALMVVAAIYAIWQSLRAAFGAVDSFAFTSAAGSVERQALEDRKTSLLRGLKDLKFEYQIGKLSDADYKVLDGELRGMARKVMRLLDDDIKGHHETAKREIEEYLRENLGGDPYRDAPAVVEDATESLSCPSCETENDFDANICKKCGVRLAEHECVKCDTLNDADATFCKKCGHKFDAAQAEAEAEGDAEAEAEGDAEAEADSEADGDGEADADSEVDDEAETDSETDSDEEDV